MIRLTRLNRAPMVLNSDLIEHIDVTPDTVITLTTGQILRVRETADEVVERIVEFRRRVHGHDAPPHEALEWLTYRPLEVTSATTIPPYLDRYWSCAGAVPMLCQAALSRRKEETI